MTIWRYKNTKFIYNNLHGRTLPSDVFHYFIEGSFDKNYIYVVINIVEFLAMDDSITPLAMHWKSMSVTHDIYNLIRGTDEHQDVFKSLTSQTMWSEYM